MYLARERTYNEELTTAFIRNGERINERPTWIKQERPLCTSRAVN